ncbi:MAG TPA: C69 family dipeptidase [Acidimicrobiales bacterium]|nr:C69 family dipeptidase [Acidimicrobiales bacterium]
MCDCLVALPAATARGATLFAKNSDRPPHEAQRVEWLAPRRDTGAVRTTWIEVEPHPADTIGVLVSRPWWMWGVEHGVNEAGVAAGNETIYTTLDPRGAPPALLGMDLVRLALERADTAHAAVAVITDLLERYGQGGSGHHGVERPYWSSFLVADPTDAWVVESSGTTWATERVTDVRAISNRTTIPSFDAEHRHPRQPVETLVDPRLNASRAVLGAGAVDAPALRAHLRSHVGGADGWTVCMHVPEVEATTASVIAELPVADRPWAHVLLGSPCTSVFVPLPVGRPLGEPVAWEAFTALGPTDRTRLDELEAELVADARDDDEWPAEAWRRVAQVVSAATQSR